MNKLIIAGIALFLLNGCNSNTNNQSMLNVSYGKAERIGNFDSKYISPRNVDVWLPDSYTENEKYPVLYMHDGQMLFDSTTTWNKQEWGVDEVLGKLIAEEIIRSCIVVGIWNTENRHSEYFPQKPFGNLSPEAQDSLINQAKRNNESSLFSTGIQSDNYLKFIVKKLKPHIDSAYSTLKDRKNTFVAGSSMGGLISMYAVCEYPDVFGGAACLSTHWPGTFSIENNPIPGAFRQYMFENLPDPQTHKFYFDYGTETLDAMYEPFQQKVDSVMEARGYDTTNWKTVKFEGHDHSEKSWRKRLHIPVTFLLKE